MFIFNAMDKVFGWRLIKFGRKKLIEGNFPCLERAVLG